MITASQNIKSKEEVERYLSNLVERYTLYPYQVQPETSERTQGLINALSKYTVDEIVKESPNWFYLPAMQERERIREEIRRKKNYHQRVIRVHNMLMKQLVGSQY